MTTPHRAGKAGGAPPHAPPAPNRPVLLFDAHASTHAPASHAPILTAPFRVPHGVPDPPLLERRPKNRALATGLGQRGDPARATGESNRHRRRGAPSGLAARRTAFARGLGDRCRIPSPVAVCGPAIRVDRAPASLRRRRAARAGGGGGGGTGLRAAPSRRTSGGPARARPHDPAPAGPTPTDELPRRFRQKNTTKPHKNHKKS